MVVRPLVLPGIGPPTVASTTNASIASKSPAPTSTDNSDVTQIGNAWSVDGVGIFDHRAVYTFHHGFPEGLQKSNYTLHQRGRGSSPVVAFNPQYDPRNVHIVNGMLALTVPGRQKPSQNSGWRLGCAQVETVADNIQYGSVRTKAIFSQVPGTCHGEQLCDSSVTGRSSNVPRPVLLPIGYPRGRYRVLDRSIVFVEQWTTQSHSHVVHESSSKSRRCASNPGDRARAF